MKTLLLLFLSLNSLSECFVKSTICVGKNETSNDYELIDKSCLFSYMEEDSSKLVKYIKNYQYFIIKNNYKNIKNFYNLTKEEFYKEDYRPFSIKFIRKSFILKNLKNKSKSVIPLSDSTCSFINYIESIPGH